MGSLIKFIGAAIWICAVTIGAVFYSFQTAGAKPEPPKPAPMFGGLDYVRTDVISVPLMKNTSVDGYFLTRLVYIVEPKQMAALSVPAEALIVDEVYTYLYANPLIDFSKDEDLDLDAFRNRIRERINARVGQELVHDILVEQVDFLSKKEVRDNTVRRKTGTADQPAAAKPAAH